MVDPFVQLSQSIPFHRCITYTSSKALADVMEGIEETRPEGEYVIFADVDSSDLHSIDIALGQRALRKHARFTYEDGLRALIIRLMPGPGHELTSRGFSYEIMKHVDALPGQAPRSLINMGATTFHVPGQRSKEADEAFFPRTRQRGEFPSVVIEVLFTHIIPSTERDRFEVAYIWRVQVGLSESLHRLRMDAQWWLINSNGTVKMVIIIRLQRNPHSIRIEQWEMVTSRPITRHNSTGMHPASTSIFEIDQHGIATPANVPLTIPYLTMFDQPRVGAADIVITSQELSAVALCVFQLC